MTKYQIKFNKGWNCGDVLVFQYKGWKTYLLKRTGRTFPGDFNSDTYLIYEDKQYSVIQLECNKEHLRCQLKITTYDTRNGIFTFKQEQASQNYVKSMGFGFDDTADIITTQISCLQYTKRRAPIMLETACNSIENFAQDQLSAEGSAIRIVCDNYPKYNVASILQNPDHYAISMQPNMYIQEFV